MTPEAIAKRRAEERRFLEAPERWPRAPLLPVKRTTPEGRHDTAVLVYRGPTQDYGIIHPANIWDHADLLKQFARRNLRLLTLDELQNEGWVID
jgi:hypothetical protein